MAKKKVAKPVEAEVKPVIEEVVVVETPSEKVEEAPAVPEVIAFHDSELPALEQIEEAKKEVDAQVEDAPVIVAPQVHVEVPAEAPTVEVWDADTHTKFHVWSQAGAYEIRFKGGVVYDSIKPCGVISFAPAYVRIGHRRFSYTQIQLIRK